eukprot:evm.model.scf_1459.3 EVM.evm.TU.scf_1459.3   scf_1459:26555-29460(+)
MAGTDERPAREPAKRVAATGAPEARAPPSGGQAPCGEATRAKFSTSQMRVNGEDVVFAREGLTTEDGGPVWSLYCVCDGHGGSAAANYVRGNLWSALAPRLPGAALPEVGSTDFEAFALAVRAAATNAFMKIGDSFITDVAADTSGGS